MLQKVLTTGSHLGVLDAALPPDVARQESARAPEAAPGLAAALLLAAGLALEAALPLSVGLALLDAAFPLALLLEAVLLLETALPHVLLLEAALPSADLHLEASLPEDSFLEETAPRRDSNKKKETLGWWRREIEGYSERSEWKAGRRGTWIERREEEKKIERG